MASTQTQTSQQNGAAAAQPPEQGHALRDTALGVVALSVLPKPPGPVDAALTVTQVVQATTALLTALRRFQSTRAQAFEQELRKEALAEEPTMGDVIDSIIAREMGFEGTFRAKQYERVNAELGPALSVADLAERKRRVKAIFDRERRYTQMREAAMRVRALAAIRHYHLEQASPDGAYWILGEHVKQHTLDCLAMANHFWPWSVLHAFQPPVHHGCACKLLSLHEAVGHGLMTPEQIPDEGAAISHATDLLRQAADQMREGALSEADIEAYLTGLLEEARWTDRFASGTTHGGEFRPKAGGDPGARLLKRLGLGQRGKVMHDLMPDAEPLSRTERGRWAWVKGRYRRIPFARDWREQIGGETFHSPAGTTNVLRDGKLLSLPELAPERRAALHDRLATAVHASQAGLVARPGEPLRPGDGPEAVLAMEHKGYQPRRVAPHGPGAWKISYVHTGTGQVAHAVVTKRGEVTAAHWDPAPIPDTTPEAAKGAPRSFKAHARDAKAWAEELRDKYGAGLKLGSIKATHELEDHAGLHEHAGPVWLGKDVAHDIENAGRARKAGRELTADEKLGVWASMHATAHEIAHAVNPIHPELFHGEQKNLEEALAEETAHKLAVERLAAQGQHDVLAWRDENPDAIPVRGVYRNIRGALADVLDSANVTNPRERERVIEALKFEIAPEQRFRVLGAMIHQAHPEVSVEDGEARARHALRRGGTPRGALPASPGFLKTLFGGEEPKKPQTSPKTPLEQPKVKTEVKAAPKPPPVKIGGGPEPAQQGPIPTFRHVPLELGKRSWRFSGLEAKGPDGSYIVKEHGGDRNRVASELLANAVYRTVGINVPTMGHVQTPGAPDFAQIPDALETEPPLPENTRVSTGVIIRAPNGKVTLIEPRNHFGGYQHTFPKGGMEPGLTAQQNALKELWEETGLHARIVGVVGDFKGDTGVSRYYVGVLTGGKPTPSDETQAINTVTMKQAAEMLNKQRDKDVLAAVAKLGVVKGKYPDVFPPTVPGSGLAFREPKGKKFDVRQANDQLAAGYVTDALLGNWDFVGRGGENLRWDDGPVRVSHSAVFEHRANGEPKPYGDVPEELWSMLYRGQAAGLVDASEEQLRSQARKVAHALTNKRIGELVAAAPFRDEKTRQRIGKMLRARVGWLRRFGNGEIDLPQPAEGAEARALHRDAQRRFPIYPEEHQAMGDYLGPLGREFDETMREGKRDPSAAEHKMANRLDAVLNDAKTGADSYAYIGYDKDIGPGIVGQTVKQRSFTLAHTSRDAATGKTRIRLTVPGGSRAYHVEDAEQGAPDMLIARGARMRITSIGHEADGTKVAHAMLLPYERPGPLIQPKAKQTSLPYKTGSAFGSGGDDKFEHLKAGAAVVHGDDGRTGKVTDVHRAYSHLLKATVAWDDGEKKTYRQDHEFAKLKPPTEQSAMAFLLEAEQTNTGSMVALFPHPSTAKKFALPDGEPPSELHVTLAFLGDKDKLRDPDKLKDTVAQWAAQTPPLEGQVSGHGLFTAGEEPVTYLSPDLPGLPAAREDLVQRLDKSGHPPMRNHGFSPHMTLAYKDHTASMPDHGGHKLRFAKATVAIGDERHHFKLEGKR